MVNLFQALTGIKYKVLGSRYYEILNSRNTWYFVLNTLNQTKNIDSAISTTIL